MSERLLVGISGSSGSILGIRLLEVLADTDLEVHLVVTEAARGVMEHETGRKVADLHDLASRVYEPDEMFAPVASGSFRTSSAAGAHTSTIGQEKRSNPVLQFPDRDAFIAGQLAGLQPYPAYYAMKQALQPV